MSEIFVLDAFLDRLYYETLMNEKKKQNKKSKFIISEFIDYLIEIYNIKVIYRGIKNNIDRKLLVQFLIKNPYFSIYFRFF